MNISSFVRTAVKETGKTLPEKNIRKLIGSFKTAGDLPINLMLDLVKQEISRYSTQEKNNKGSEKKPESVFSKIDAAIAEGKCPICGNPMTDVKLADYTPAKYCAHDCRVVLWGAAE